MEKEIRTGLENQERKIVDYLFSRRKYSAKDILETCKDPVLRLNPYSVEGAVQEHELSINKDNKLIKEIKRGILVAVAASSLISVNPFLPVPSYSFGSDIVEYRIEIDKGDRNYIIIDQSNPIVDKTLEDYMVSLDSENITP
jgi:hypothetical protein